jgi:tetratricopeptide (TPR) repeat protein
MALVSSQAGVSTSVRYLRLSVTASFVFLAFLLLCSPLQGQELGNIVGQIRTQDGGFPSERIMVTLEGRGAIINSAYCDDDGRFGFYGLVANPYYVVIELKEYEPVREKVVVVPTTSQTNIVHLVLRPLTITSKNAPDDSISAANSNVVNIGDLARKFPPEAVREFEAGMNSERHSEMDAAVRHYQIAIRLAPDFYPAHNNLGIRELQKGNLKAAEEEFRRVLELNSNSSQAYFNLGNVLYLTQRNEEAKSTIEQGLRRSPSSAMGRYFLGSVLTRLREFNSAEEQLKTARGLDPKLPQVYLALATLYLQTAKQKQAVQMFEDFLRQFPNDPMAPKVRAAMTKLTQQTSP